MDTGPERPVEDTAWKEAPVSGHAHSWRLHSWSISADSSQNSAHSGSSTWDCGPGEGEGGGGWNRSQQKKRLNLDLNLYTLPSASMNVQASLRLIHTDWWREGGVCSFLPLIRTQVSDGSSQSHVTPQTLPSVLPPHPPTPISGDSGGLLHRRLPWRSHCLAPTSDPPRLPLQSGLGVIMRIRRSNGFRAQQPTSA